MRYSLKHIKTWLNYSEQQRSGKHWKQFVCRKNQKHGRRRDTELSWNAEWKTFSENFQLLCKEVNSQWKKRLIRLHRQLINIRRRSRLFVDRLDHQLHQQKRSRGRGSNSATIGAGKTSQHSSRLAR
jgi:hypothetical protein